jgi:hypothetical protein
MTVSGQGLVYEFEAMEQDKSYYAKVSTSMLQEQ